MAFGNPNISSNPVGDMYSSQADTYGNSFESPMNEANMNPGWGINPNLLTPGRQANYRPQYSGPSGAIDYGRPGFFSAAWKLANPFAPDPRWGDPFMHQQQNIESVSSRPVDAAVWGAQRIAAPALAYSGAMAAMGGSKFGIFSKGGYSAGSSFGKGLGSGISRGFGFSSSSIMARGASGVLGAAGGVAMGIAAPILATQAMMWGAEKAIFNPYQNTRRSALDLRQNFSGISLADSSGHSVHGGGLGGFESAQMAGQITRQGIGDMTFSAGEYGAGASMIQRSGLMDNATGKSNVTQKIKDAMTQVKLIMSIAAMPEMKDAIEQLAKLQLAGAGINGGMQSTASKTMQQLGGYAAQAGMSVQKLMNTSGAQGEYLYQQNGMTGYLGQLAAGNSVASFAAANRMGLISEATLSRMGGISGAAQSSITGQVNVSQSLYGKMSNYNRYLGSRGAGGSAVDNITKFGSDMASDPLEAYGKMQLYGPILGSRDIKDRGSRGLEDQVIQFAEASGAVRKGQKLSAEKAFGIMTGAMQMDRDSAIAGMQQIVNESDPTTSAKRNKDLDIQYEKQRRQYISNNGLYGGVIGSNYYAINKAGRRAVKNIAENTAQPVAELVGTISDKVSRGYDQVMYGGTIDSSKKEGEALKNSIYDSVGLGSAREKFNKDDLQVFDGNGQSFTEKFVNSAKSIPSVLNPFLMLGGATGNSEKNSRHSEVVSSLQSLLQKGDPLAEKYFRKDSTATEKSDALSKLIQSGKLGDNPERLKEYLKNPSNRVALENDLNSRRTRAAKDTDLKAEDYSKYSGSPNMGSFEKVEKASSTEVDRIYKITGSKDDDIGNSLRSINEASEVNSKMAGGDLSTDSGSKALLEDKDLKKFMDRIGETDPIKAMQRAEEMTKAAQANGSISLARNFAKGNGKVQDSKIQEAIDKLDKSDPNYASRVKELTLGDAAGQAGGYHVGANKNAKNQTGSEVAGDIEIQKIHDDQIAQNNELRKDRRIDPSSWMQNTAAIENTKSSSEFKAAVKMFADAVNKSTGNTPGSGNNSSPESAYYNRPQNNNTKTSENSSGNPKQGK